MYSRLLKLRGLGGGLEEKNTADDGFEPIIVDTESKHADHSATPHELQPAQKCASRTKPRSSWRPWSEDP